MGKDFEAPVLCAVVDPTINKLATHLFESTQSVMCRCRCTVQHLANLNEGVLQVVVQLVNLVYHWCSDFPPCWRLPQLGFPAKPDRPVLNEILLQLTNLVVRRSCEQVFSLVLLFCLGPWSCLHHSLNYNWSNRNNYKRSHFLVLLTQITFYIVLRSHYFQVTSQNHLFLLSAKFIL